MLVEGKSGGARSEDPYRQPRFYRETFASLRLDYTRV